MWMMIGFAALAWGTPVPDLTVREPTRPRESSTSLHVDCGTTFLDVRDFGYVLPAGASPTIHMDGRPITGEGVEALLSDLSDQRALYRLIARCRQGRRSIWLLIYRVSGPASAMTYRVGNAVLTDGRVESYSGLEAGGPEDIW